MRSPGATLLRRWRRTSGIARDFVVVGGATAVGQGAILLVAPVLARLYAPEEFGLLATFAAVLSVLVSVASLRFDLAIPIADDRPEAVRLFVISVIVPLVVSVVIAAGLLIWGGQLAALVDGPSIAPLLWLLPFALFLASLVQALASWAVYTRAFSDLGGMRMVQGVVQASGQVALGFLGVGALGLILGDIASRIVGAGRLLRATLPAVRTTPITAPGIAAAARKSWGFARVMTGASLLTALSLQVPFLLIPLLFDLGAAGQYFLALRALAIPASFVAAAVGQVFFGEASHRRIDAGKLHDLTHDAAMSLFVFSIPTYGIMLVAGQALFVTVFGPEWQQAGFYAQIMAPSLVFWTVANPMSSLPLIGRRERESLMFTAAEFGLRVIALGIGAAVGSLLTGIVVLAIASLVIEAAATWRFLRVASVTMAELAVPVLRVVATTAPCLLVLVVTVIAVPGATPVVAVLAWAAAIGLAVRGSREARALVSSAYE